MNNTPQAGDLIFYPPVGSFWDFWIRMVSPNFTHVGIYINEDVMVDANLWTIERRPFNKFKGVTIKRVKGITEQEAKRLCEYALWQAGESYSVFGAVVAGIKYLLGIKSRPSEDRDSNWQCAKLATKGIRNTLSVSLFPGTPSSDVFPDMLYAWDGLETIKVYE